MTSIRTEKLERAVLDAIWENLSDEDSGLEEAWADNYPDQNKIDELQKKVEVNRKKFRKAKENRDKLVKALLNGVLTEDAIKNKNEALSKEIQLLLWIRMKND